MRAATAVFALLALSISSSAVFSDGYHKRRSVEKGDNYALSRRAPEVRGFLFRPGGHRYGYEYESYLSREGPYGNYPLLDSRNFWERVQSDPRSNTVSPSAF
jgi:hypothetical protein